MQTSDRARLPARPSNSLTEVPGEISLRADSACLIDITHLKESRDHASRKHGRGDRTPKSSRRRAISTGALTFTDKFDSSTRTMREAINGRDHALFVQSSAAA